MFNRTFMMAVVLVMSMMFSSACAANNNHYPFMGYERLTNKELDTLVYPVQIYNQTIIDDKDADVCLIDKANILKKNPAVIVGIDCFGVGSTSDARYLQAAKIAEEIFNRLVELGVNEDQMLIFVHETGSPNLNGIGNVEFAIMVNTPDEVGL